MKFHFTVIFLNHIFILYILQFNNPQLLHRLERRRENKMILHYSSLSIICGNKHIPPNIFLFFKVYLFYERERGRQRTCVLERGRERILSRLHAVSTEPDMGPVPRTPRSLPEMKSRVSCFTA